MRTDCSYSAFKKKKTSWLFAHEVQRINLEIIGNYEDELIIMNADFQPFLNATEFITEVGCELLLRKAGFLDFPFDQFAIIGDD